MPHTRRMRGMLTYHTRQREQARRRRVGTPLVWWGCRRGIWPSQGARRAGVLLCGFLGVNRPLSDDGKATGRSMSWWTRGEEEIAAGPFYECAGWSTVNATRRTTRNGARGVRQSCWRRAWQWVPQSSDTSSERTRVRHWPSGPMCKWQMTLARGWLVMGCAQWMRKWAELVQSGPGKLFILFLFIFFCFLSSSLLGLNLNLNLG
jgi:hypothetical protein